MGSAVRPELVAKGGSAAPGDLALGEAVFSGAAGWMVRCTPRRRVLRVEGTAGTLYAKIRQGAWRDAVHEWQWLNGEGPPVPLPAPIGLWRAGSRSLLLARAAPGRPVQVLLSEASADPDSVDEFLRTRAAPVVAALHSSGWVYRDLYWNHWFAESLHDPVHLIDVERAFRPAWRRRRWIVKDLAGLVSSAEPPLECESLRRAYACYIEHGGLSVPLRHVVRKAAAIRARQPRFG